MSKKYYVTAEGLERLKKRLVELKELEAKNIDVYAFPPLKNKKGSI